MSSLVDKVNKEISRWGMQLTFNDILENGKPALVISDRNSLRDRIDEIRGRNIPLSELKRQLKEYDVVLIEHSDNYPDCGGPDTVIGTYYDCRDWVFDKVGLPQYTCRDRGLKADRLLREDFTRGYLDSPPGRKCHCSVFQYYSQ